MTAKEIIDKCAHLELNEKRQIADDYAELVFFNKDIEVWIKVLSEVMGAAAKPAGEEPSPDDLKLTEDFGGIFANQTLFKKEFGDSAVIAMFWPWSDNLHTTLKVAVLNK